MKTGRPFQATPFRTIKKTISSEKFTRRCSHRTRHRSHRTMRQSHPTRHRNRLTMRQSHPTRRQSHPTRHRSRLTKHQSHLTMLRIHLTMRQSPPTRRQSHQTRRRSRLTRIRIFPPRSYSHPTSGYNHSMLLPASERRESRVPTQRLSLLSACPLFSPPFFL